MTNSGFLFFLALLCYPGNESSILKVFDDSKINIDSFYVWDKKP